MNLSIRIFIIALCLFLACKTKVKHQFNSLNGQATLNYSCTDSFGVTVYEFVDLLIKDQTLDATCGIEESPLPRLGYEFSDSAFLQQHLMLERSKKASHSKTLGVMTMGMLDSCLTQNDIDFMLNQIKENKSFRWNSQCLNFRNSNENNEKYSVSVPLFSEDKSKFIIAVDSYSKGGKILLYRKENDRWVSTIESYWIH